MVSMLRNGRTSGDQGLSYAGCSCHNSKAAHRRVKKAAKQKEQRGWKRTEREAY